MRKTPAGHLEKAKDISAPRLSDFGEDNKRLEREGRAQLEHNDSLFVSHEGEAHSFEVQFPIDQKNISISVLELFYYLSITSIAST